MATKFPGRTADRFGPRIAVLGGQQPDQTAAPIELGLMRKSRHLQRFAQDRPIGRLDRDPPHRARASGKRRDIADLAP